MKSKTIRLQLCFAAGFLFTLLIETNGHANGLENHFAKLHQYFFHLNAFPIKTPQSEEPGDVYVSPAAQQIYLRRADCFKELQSTEHDTDLPRTIEVRRSDLRGDVSIELRRIGTTAAKNDIQLNDVAEISFGHPNGRPKLRQLDHGAVVALLVHRAEESPCRAALMKFLRANPGNDVLRGVPWIIEAVWYASSKLSVQTQQNVNAEAQTKLENDFSRLQAGANIEVKRAGGGLVLVSTGKSVLPVAWRPAFISSRHFNDILELEATGWFKRFRQWLGWENSREDILLLLRKEFDFDFNNVPRPEVIDRLMSQGPAMEFDSGNPKHLEYIKNVNAYYALSWHIYGGVPIH
jgi:hypothetical protein